MADRRVRGPGAAPVAAAAAARAFRDEWGRCVATIARITRDLDVAEDAVQEAFVAALRRWPVDGLPANPGAWITTAARNRALDRLRREARRSGKEQAAVRELERAADEQDPPAAAGAVAAHPVSDDRLQLVFACCHPALSEASQIALTLRLVCGLTTVDIARAFLQPQATVAQRISRAKRRVRDAGIPLEAPPPERLPDRLPAVLACVHLVYREGYAATGTDGLVRERLCDEGCRLAELLARLLPDEPEVLGLSALLLLHDARRPTRTDVDGRIVLLPGQNRARWNRTAIDAGLATLDRAAVMGRPGPYQLQAAIAAEHARAPTWEATDWQAIVALYDALARQWPSPVIELNRAVAIAELRGPAAGLAALDPIRGDPRLARSHLLPATWGELLRRLGRHAEARAALEQALRLAPTGAERRLLDERLAELATRRDRTSPADRR